MTDVKLSKAADDIGLRKQKMSEDVAGEILQLFRTSLRFTLSLVIILELVDALFIWQHFIKPTERLISERVILTLIGASVVQVGAASAAIIYGLFERTQRTKPNLDDEENVTT